MSRINLDALILFHNVRQDIVIQASINFFDELYGDIINCQKIDYYTVQRLLLAATDSHDIKGSYWQNYICKLVAESENFFSMMSEKGEIDENIRSLVIREMDEIKKLYRFDWNIIANAFQDEISVCCLDLNPKDFYRKLKREKVKTALEVNSNQESVDILFEYYGTSGCGVYEKYDAFVWDQGLIGIKNYDKISFDKLVGYEKQKEALIENTELFLMGHKANNVLLYGDRGTGKSSCVKALLNKYHNHKLKIISLNKNQIYNLNKIIESIADRGCKFIIFIDDLSFEDTEVVYKDFKSVIEGGIEAQPLNTLIYVTSNRRNIIKETWKERGDEGGDVHYNDGMQERLSLADRFGLSITFTSPDKSTYLEIVKGLAKQEALEVNESELIQEALKWELRQSGRSGRTARQFIYYMQGKKMKQI